jgi:hypothetical protein
MRRIDATGRQPVVMRTKSPFMSITPRRRQPAAAAAADAAQTACILPSQESKLEALYARDDDECSIGCLVGFSSKTEQGVFFLRILYTCPRTEVIITKRHVFICRTCVTRLQRELDPENSAVTMMAMSRVTWVPVVFRSAIRTNQVLSLISKHLNAAVASLTHQTKMRPRTLTIDRKINSGEQNPR